MLGSHNLTSPTVELPFPFLFEVDDTFEAPLPGHQTTDADTTDADAGEALDYDLDDLIRCLTDTDGSGSDSGSDTGSGSEAEAEAELDAGRCKLQAPPPPPPAMGAAPGPTSDATATAAATITPPPSPPTPPSAATPTTAPTKPTAAHTATSTPTPTPAPAVPVPKSRGAQRDSVVRRNKTRQAGKAKSTSKKFGQATTPLDGALLRLFPKHVLRSTKEDYKDFKDAVAAGVSPALSPKQLERLSQLRRRELSCVYADQQRKKKSEQQAQVNGALQRLADENAAVKQENERLLREVAVLRRQLAAR